MFRQELINATTPAKIAPTLPPNTGDTNPQRRFKSAAVSCTGAAPSGEDQLRAGAGEEGEGELGRAGREHAGCEIRNQHSGFRV